jgi:hypothetical protein
MSERSSKLKKWAKVAAQEYNQSACKTCQSSPEALEVIREFVAAQDAGDPDFASMPVAGRDGRPSLLSFLREEYGYKLGDSALRRHVLECIRGQKG